jgi:hypothetical protein
MRTPESRTLSQIWISRDKTCRAPLDSSGKVLVVIRIFADTAQHV